ncbi:peritrophin-48-like [Drosophila nasuta]|uniref:peritrophin-48-like n=1 Tax=Drosophila nasuta TaxID=42062 RepID=UPI00295E4B0B|nr:peritrophin-48-like [Drosophila nasuta]
MAQQSHSVFTRQLPIMAGTFLFATILCLALGNALAADVLEGSYNVTQVCTMVKTGTSLGSIQSCDYYYVCGSSGPVKTACSTGYSYNFRTQTCQPTAQVTCYYGMENPCAGKTGSSFVPKVNTCNGWYWCNGETIGNTGTCASGQKFDSTAQKCIYGSCLATDSTDEDSLSSYCDVVPPGMYFGSVSNCKQWYSCSSNGTLSTGDCASSAFIVQTGSCGYDTDAGACDRIVEAATPSSCTSSGTKAPSNTTCGTWYLCNGSTYVEQICPTGTYYDVGTEACVTRATATPAAGCNRCQYATTTFVNAVNDELCDTYYYCSDGKAGSVTTCPGERFFNEDIQACDNDSKLAAYVPTHGACKGASISSTSTTVSGATDSSASTVSGETAASDASTDAPTTVTAEATTN